MCLVSIEKKLCGKKHQYKTIPFFFFLKKTKPMKQKDHEHELFNNGANKNEAINILGFKSI